ncbi:unnamed protein product, partial [Amoebophrya sp. A25]
SYHFCDHEDQTGEDDYTRDSTYQGISWSNDNPGGQESCSASQLPNLPRDELLMSLKEYKWTVQDHRMEGRPT